MSSTTEHEDQSDAKEEEEGDETTPNMTKKAIMNCCKKHDLYRFPELNDTLYLHYEGFPKIKNLEEFVNLKSLWLNNNQITVIENLSCLKQLTSLNLQNNLISDIEGLDELVNLDTLILSNNYISEIKGLRNLKKLVTFEIDYNHVKTADGFAGILECPSISVLNIVHNQIDDPEVIEVLAQMQNLKVLRMDNNPIVPHTKNYRRVLTHKCLKLQYLDDAQITAEDRKMTEAWLVGGKQAEMEVRQKIKEEKRAREIQDLKDFRRMQRNAMLKAGGNIKDYPELMSSDDENIENQKNQSTNEEKQENENDDIFVDVTQTAENDDIE